MFSNPFESTLQKLVQTMGACRLILLMRSSSAKSGESSIPASSKVPLDFRNTLSTFRQTPHQDTVSSNSHLSDSFSAPSGFFASASTILISSTQSSGFLSQESPITDVFTQYATLRGSLVLAVDHLWFSWRSMSCFASLHDSIRAGCSEPTQSRSHVQLPSIMWIHVVCSDCSAGSDSS